MPGFIARFKKITGNEPVTTYFIQIYLSKSLFVQLKFTKKVYYLNTALKSHCHITFFRIYILIKLTLFQY
jgi:hypothetical protein